MISYILCNILVVNQWITFPCFLAALGEIGTSILHLHVHWMNILGSSIQVGSKNWNRVRKKCVKIVTVASRYALVIRISAGWVITTHTRGPSCIHAVDKWASTEGQMHFSRPCLKWRIDVGPPAPQPPPGQVWPHERSCDCLRSHLLGSAILVTDSPLALQLLDPIL